MKNWKIYSIIVTVLLVLVVVGFLVYFFLFKETISEKEAKKIAFEYANVLESDITILSINKDYDDREYSIKFFDDIYEYEIDVNYNNGRVKK